MRELGRDIFGKDWNVLPTPTRRAVMQALCWCLEHQSELCLVSSDREDVSEVMNKLRKVMDVDGALMKTRRRSVVEQREMLMAVLRYRSTASLHQLEALTGYDHATIVHTVSACNRDYRYDRTFREKFDDLTTKIKTL